MKNHNTNITWSSTAGTLFGGTFASSASSNVRPHEDGEGDNGSKIFALPKPVLPTLSGGMALAIPDSEEFVSASR